MKIKIFTEQWQKYTEINLQCLEIMSKLAIVFYTFTKYLIIKFYVGITFMY